MKEEEEGSTWYANEPTMLARRRRRRRRRRRLLIDLFTAIDLVEKKTKKRVTPISITAPTIRHPITLSVRPASYLLFSFVLYRFSFFFRRSFVFSLFGLSSESLGPVLPSFTEFHRVIPRINLVLPSFTGFSSFRHLLRVCT